MSLEVPEEPIINEAERAALIDFIQVQTAKTLEAARNRDRLTSADAAEAFLDLGLLLGSVLAPPGVGALIVGIGNLAKPLVVDAIEKAEAKSRTAERLLQRANEKDAAADEHIADASVLAETPKREFLEKMRIGIHLRRARYLRVRAVRLRAEAAVLTTTLPVSDAP